MSHEENDENDEVDLVDENVLPYTLMPSQLMIPLRCQLKPTPIVGIPTLWVFETGDSNQLLFQLTQNYDEEIFARLLWFQSASLCVLYWDDPKPPLIVFQQAQAYVADVRINNLFLPEGYRLVPTLRIDFLREQVPLGDDSLTWLSPLQQKLTSYSIKKTELRPVRDFLSYIRPSLLELEAKTWGPSPFRLMNFVEENLNTSPVQVDSLAAVTLAESSKSRDEFINRKGLWSRAFSWACRVIRKSKPRPQKPSELGSEATNADRPSQGRFETVVSVASVDNQIARLEKQFLTGPVQKLSPASGEMWENLSVAYETAGAYPEAALTWLLAVWEGGTKVPQWAWGWLRSEARAARGEVRHLNPREWLERSPSTRTTRVLAAWVVWAQLQPTLPEEFRELAPKIQARLDEGENALPVRAAWLARKALASVAQGDVLLLAQAADRLMKRWSDGPISDLDVPPFLRFPTHAAQARHRQARSWIIEKRELIHGWLQRIWSNMPFPTRSHLFPKTLAPFGLEMDVPLTKSYTDILLAWGAAKFGEHTIANKFFQQGRENLPQTQPHLLLLDAWGFRIEQARRSRNQSLPQEFFHTLNRLETLPKYAVESWLSRSRILEPSRTLPPNLYNPKNAEILPTLRDVSDYEQYMRSFPREIAKRNLSDFLMLDRELARSKGGVLDYLLDQVREIIFNPTTEESVRTQMTLGYVNGLRLQPVGVVVARLEELFSRMNSLDFFGSVNRYFCLPALLILEGAIGALVPADLEPNSPARIWLEADEWRVIRKIRSELQAALREAGLEG